MLVCFPYLNSPRSVKLTIKLWITAAYSAPVLRDTAILGLRKENVNKALQVLSLSLTGLNVKTGLHQKTEYISGKMERMQKKPVSVGYRFIWCPDPELNQGHGDFQSPALPTELSGQIDYHL